MEHDWEVQGVKVHHGPTHGCTFAISGWHFTWEPHEARGTLSLLHRDHGHYTLQHIPSAEAAVSAARAFLFGICPGVRPIAPDDLRRRKGGT